MASEEIRNNEAVEIEEVSKPYYRIPRENLEGLEDKLAKLNRRAVKLGLPEITWEQVGGETVEERIKQSPPRYRYRENIFVVVKGEHPHFEGWTFVAALDHFFGSEAGSEALIRTAPHHEGDVPKEFRNRSNVCDHCGHNRQRKSTYLVRHEDEGYRQVGSTCIKDFLGGKSPDALASWAEIIFSLDRLCGEFEEGGDFAGGRSDGYHLLNLLPQVAAFIREDGWVSRTAARDDYRKVATVDQATSWIWDHNGRKEVKRTDPDRYDALQVTDADRKLVTDALNWVTENWEPLEDKNDYQHNVCLLVRQGYTPNKLVGIAGSIVGVYLRELNRQAEQAARKALPDIVDECFGEVGKRVVVPAYVSGINGFEGYYGWTTVVSLVVTFDGNPHRATWFATGDTLVDCFVEHNGVEALVKGYREVERGDKLFVRGTIKKHGEYKGKAQTGLNRCCLFDYDPDDKETKKRIRKLKKDGLVLGKWEWDNKVRELDREAVAADEAA